MTRELLKKNRGDDKQVDPRGYNEKNESFLPRHLIHPLLFNPPQILQPLKQSINISLPILTETPNAEVPRILNLSIS